jgi:hypothetical protein
MQHEIFAKLQAHFGGMAHSCKHSSQSFQCYYIGSTSKRTSFSSPVELCSSIPTLFSRALGAVLFYTTLVKWNTYSVVNAVDFQVRHTEYLIDADSKPSCLVCV